MVTVSSAFISSRRERIIFSVLSASGCAFKAAAWVDVLTALGKTDLDNTDVARDHSFHCIAGTESLCVRVHSTHVGLMVSISNPPVFEVRKSFQPFPISNPGKKQKGWQAIQVVRFADRYCVSATSSFHPGSAGLSMTDSF